MENTVFIWDLDGTLLDSYELIVSSLCQAYREFGADADPEEVHRKIIARSVNDFISEMEETAGIPFDAVKKRLSEISEREKLNIRPIDGAAETLRQLKKQGCTHYVFTHRGTTSVPVLKNTGLFEFFDEIVTGKDGFPRKPDPSALNYLVRKYGLTPENTCYVGDRPIDIECAVNAGIKSILYLPEDNPAHPTGKETKVIRSLRDLITL